MLRRQGSGAILRARTSGAFFFWLPCAVTPELGGRVLLSTRNVAPIAEHKPKV